jgi:hypothetical protein
VIIVQEIMFMSNEEFIELIHALQVQQIELNSRLMDKWQEMGDLMAEILDINYKVLSILKDKVDDDADNDSDP